MSNLLPRRARLGLPASAFLAVALLGAVMLVPKVTAEEPAPVPARDTGLAGLQRAQIPTYELKIAGGGDPAQAPAALVAILGESRLKHLSYVTAVVFSPDGQALASAGVDGMVRLWNPATGEEQRRFRAPREYGVQWDRLAGVAFSPDGRTLAAGGINQNLVLWDVATGRQLRVLRADSAIAHLAFSPDGRLLATGHEVDAQIWDLSTNKLLHKLTKPSEESDKRYRTAHMAVAFTADGKTLFVGHPDGTVGSWDTKAGKLLHSFKAHDLAISGLSLSKDERWLATASLDKAVRLWEPRTGRLVQSFPDHAYGAGAVAFHPNGKVLATADGGKVKYWDIETGKTLMTFTAAQNGGVHSLAFSPDGKLLASGGQAARIWEAAEGLPRFSPGGHLGPIQAVAFSPTGQKLVTGGVDNTVKVWDPARQRLERSLNAGTSMIAAVAVSPDGATLAALDSYKPRVHLWDLATGQPRQSFLVGGDLGEALAFSPDGRWLAVRVRDRLEGAATLWDLQKDKPHGSLLTGPGTLLFSADGKKLLVAGPRDRDPGSKSTLAIWDVATLRLETQREDLAGLGQVRAAALSRDGHTLALAGQLYGADDRGTPVVMLWDVRKQQPRLILNHGEAFVHYLDFAPDGRSLVTLGFIDADARVWDPRDGKLRETIRLCDPGAYHVPAVRFAPDSRHFAAATGNGTVYILRIQPPPDSVQEVTRVPALPSRVRSSPADLWKRLQNQPAPELRQIQGWLFGKPLRLADLRGRNVLLHFWNMNSEQELPTLMLLHELFGDQGLALIAVMPDYGAHGTPAEFWAKQFARQKERNWGGHEPSFPVALDGGGETAIGGTQLKAWGATHAAYRIPDAQRGYRLPATTLLIDPEGKVVKRMDFNQSARIVAEFEAILGKKAATPAWQALFEQLYALGDGQMLRRVSPPFPPQRSDYLFYLHGPWSLHWTQLFQFDGKLSLYRVNGKERLTLADALDLAVELKSYEVEGPADLLKLEVPGDWVVRKGAAQVQLMRALEAVLRDELQQPVRIVLRSVEREVLVAQGRYQFQPGAGQTDNYVHLCAEALPPQTRFGGGSGTLQEMLNWLGDRTGRRVLLEAEAPRLLRLSWRDHLVNHVADFQANTPAGADKLKAVLDNLSKQTGLRFLRARRQVLVWELMKEK